MSGLRGALAHPIEAAGIGSCREVMSVEVYARSPRDRIPGTQVAFPMGWVGLHAAVWATRD